MILEETLIGRVVNGIGWSSCVVEGGAAGDNWCRFVEAFRFQFSDIAAYAHGTFNVNLEGEWLPPDDVPHRLGAHQRGIELRQDWRIGADLLFNGNYIHPTIEVVAINGLSIEGGRLYFPAPAWQMADIGPRRRIEVISRTNLRQLLGIGPRDDELPIEVRLRMAEA